MNILETYFGINAKIKVYTESEIENARFRKAVTEVRASVTTWQLKYAIKGILKGMPNENCSKHYGNIIDNIAIRISNCDSTVATELQYWTKYVDNYIAYVQQYR